MKYIRISLQIAFLLISLNGFTQTSKISFQRYKILDVGYINIPSNMELQAGKFKQNLKNFANEKGLIVADKRGVFQQKGLNNFEKPAFKLYARVIIQTQTGNYGDYEKITTKLVLNPHEISVLNKSFKLQTIQSFANSENKIISWYGTSIEKVNGVSAIKFSYLRQLGDKPPVVVECYRFQNNNLLHSLEMSYRLQDEKIWKPLYSKILSSFIITNIQ